MARRFIWLLLLAAARPSSTFASTTPPDSILTLPVLEVRARRIHPQELLDRRVGTSTVLDHASWGGGAHSAAAVLARAAGVSVREQGGLGSYSIVAVRGTTSQQVPIFLDGVPIHTPSRGAANLADIPLMALDRIEVYRGAAPLVMGGASLGGAIHLHSAEARGSWLLASAGSFDTRTFQLATTTRRQGWSLNARVQGIWSDNDWEFHDDNGTIYNPHDDEIVRRINNDVRGGSALASARRPWKDWILQFTEVVDTREQGNPGHSVVQSSVARDQSLTHQFRASLARGSGRVRSLEAYHRYDRQSFYDPDGDLTRIFSDRRDAVHAVGAHATGGWSDSAGAWWRSELRFARLRSEDRLQTNSVGAPQSRWVMAGAVQPSVRVGERLLISPGARLEWHLDRHHGVPEFAALPQGPARRDQTLAPILQLGGVFRLSSETYLKASLTHMTRPPTLLERFGVRGAVAGNPDLREERSVGRDISLIWSRPEQGRRVALSAFDNDMWDLISYERVSAAHARAVNVGRASSRGVELEMALGTIGRLHWQQDLTVLSTRDRSDDRTARDSPLSGRPGMETRSALALDLTRAVLSYELVSVGHNFLQTGRRERVAARALHSVHARVPVGEHVALAVGVRNLTDQESFDLAGYPLPGRTATLTLITGVGNASP